MRRPTQLAKGGAPAHWHESSADRVADMVYLAASKERAGVPRSALPKLEREDIFNW
jgi:hypothetical protein